MAVFDAKTVQIRGTNLIEASAGTGKTYSLSILALRLMLEGINGSGKGVPIDRILMVTFTNAAAAEMELRMREFLRQAGKYAKNKAKCEEDIMIVVDQTREKIGEAECVARLDKAILALDKLQVMTIHSFCQKMITHNPLETRQRFDFQLLNNSSTVIENVVNEFWRQQINTLDNEELLLIIKKLVTKESLSAVVSKTLEEKRFFNPPKDKETHLSEINDSINSANRARDTFTDHINHEWEAIKQRDKNKPADDFFKKNNSTEAFVNALYTVVYKSDSRKFLTNYFGDELALAKDVVDKEKMLSQKIWDFLIQLLMAFVPDYVEKFKSRKNILTYDDLISVVEKAVSENHLSKVISNRYDIIFIDEFQDTDQKQYRIFNSTCSKGDNKALFYIGDPKQSIFGWRKADISTYKEARENVENLHKMNENFRSTGDLINGLNAFFSIQNPFFDKNIQYQEVTKGKIEIGELFEKSGNVLPVTINTMPNKTKIIEFVQAETFRLLKDENVLIKQRRVKPSDIAIIVRTGFEAKDIKRALTSVGIPSITIDETLIFNTEEAETIRNLLSILLKPKRGLINKLLLNPAIGYDTKTILQIDEQKHLMTFKKLREKLQDEGIYNMLFYFFETYGIRTNCLEKGLAGQRSISNFYQLAELLHKRVLETACSLEELIAYTRRTIPEKDEEHEQRIESQDDAVKIMTIHKSKGLTFNIVFAPFMDLLIKDNPELFEFRDDEGYAFAKFLPEEQKQLYVEQNNQENRRLIYVAATRARYKLYLCKNTSGQKHNSSLLPFCETKSEYFERDRSPDVPETKKDADRKLSQFTPRTPHLTPDSIKTTFSIHSFSSLNRTHKSTPFEQVALAEAYDHFVFQELSRGAKTGDALHKLFEHMQFNNENSWEQSLADSAKFYPNIFKEEHKQHLRQLIRHCMHADIELNGEQLKLSAIPDEHKIPELQFNFSVNKVNRQLINELLDEDAQLRGESDMQGLMTGFVDLLFRHNNKYYILDWKSNYLGNALDDYDQVGLARAMKANNYELQYWIYTLAVKRWLESRVKDFNYDQHFGGVIYLFIRGIREGRQTGIYVNKPAKDQIDKIDAAFRE